MPNFSEHHIHIWSCLDIHVSSPLLSSCLVYQACLSFLPSLILALPPFSPPITGLSLPQCEWIGNILSHWDGNYLLQCCVRVSAPGQCKGHGMKRMEKRMDCQTLSPTLKIITGKWTTTEKQTKHKERMDLNEPSECSFRCLGQGFPSKPFIILSTVSPEGTV